jgi:hypothetical protein
MGSYVTVSKPNLVPGSRASVTEEEIGTFRINGLDISIKPSNADVSLLSAGIIAPIIPLGAGNKIREGKHFQLIIQFEHDGENYFYMPASTILHTPTGDISPIAVTGPLTRIGSPKELEKVSFGMPWVCSDQGAPSRPEISTEIAIPAKSCLVLEFTLPTIAPKYQFSIELNGLRKDSTKLSKIEIHFNPEKRVTGSWLGGE